MSVVWIVFGGYVAKIIYTNLYGLLFWFLRHAFNPPSNGIQFAGDPIDHDEAENQRQDDCQQRVRQRRIKCVPIQVEACRGHFDPYSIEF